MCPNRRKRKRRDLGAPNGRKLSDGGWPESVSLAEPASQPAAVRCSAVLGAASVAGAGSSAERRVNAGGQEGKAPTISGWAGASSGRGNDGPFRPARAWLANKANKNWRRSQARTAWRNRRKRNPCRLVVPNGLKLSDGLWRGQAWNSRIDAAARVRSLQRRVRRWLATAHNESVDAGDDHHGDAGSPAIIR